MQATPKHPNLSHFLECPYDLKDKCLKNSFPDFYKFLIESYPSELSLGEKLYWFYNQLTEKPKCPVCGKDLKFKRFSQGYYTHCSQSCAHKDQEVLDKIVKTNIERYGVDNTSKLPEMKKAKEHTINVKYGGRKNLLKKTFGTIKKKYGVDNPSQIEGIPDKVKKTKLERYGDECYHNIEQAQKTKLERYGNANYSNHDKRRKTCLEKYGESEIMNVESHRKKCRQTKLKKYGDELYSNREKSKQTCLERYGHASFLQIPEVKEKTITKRRMRPLTTNDEILNFWVDEYGNSIYKVKCPHPEICNKCEEKWYEISSGHYFCRRYSMTEPCTRIMPIQNGRIANTTIENKIHNILDEVGIQYELHNRTILDGKELDLYIPSAKLAIECNGCYWHSDKVKSSYKYHYLKWKICKQKGIQLLTIWEDQIINKLPIVKNVIYSKLGLYDNTVDICDCVIIDIPSKDAITFFNENNIEGNKKSKCNIGIYHNNELVSAMSFKITNSKNKEWELCRFNYKIGFNIKDGFNNMLDFFIKKYKPNKIVSFSSNDIDDGKIYMQMGFKLANDDHNVLYWYIDQNAYHRYHRYNFRKSKLIKQGYDPNLTEMEIMDNNNKYFRIYDSGHQKWIYNS